MLDFGAFSIIAQDVFMTSRTPSIYDKRYRGLIDTLVEHRKSKKMTQQELADKLGISRQNISKIETGTRRIDVVELNDWLKALGIKVDLIKTVMSAV